jgi:large subunit ribosomal protein L15
VKLHDLRPAPGSTTERTRVGRGIAAGKGKTAGRGTKGQKSRAGGSIPAGFEGGQTPIHRRVPKLRGFKNPFKIAYEVVNVGRISEYAEQGRFADAEAAMEAAGLTSVAAKGAPLTVNGELLRAAGLIGTLRQPVKILGGGEIDRPLFVVADAFTKSAREKIEAAGGTAQLIELPDRPMPAIGLKTSAATATDEAEAVIEAVEAEAIVEAVEAEAAAEAVEAEPAGELRAPAAAKASKVTKASRVTASDKPTKPSKQAEATKQTKATKATASTGTAAADGEAGPAAKKPARKRTKTEPAE